MSFARATLPVFFAFVVAPVALAAPCGGFTDVDDTNPAHAPFCDSVEWMKNRGITLGCTSTTLYCPNDPVSRLQMAAFLYRLGFQNAFLQGGNAFGTTALLGTTDNRSLQLNVNGSRALTLTPATNAQYGSSPNVIGGHADNGVGITCPGICIPTPEPAVGAVVAGGGYPGATNRVTDSFGVVGGGQGNLAGNENANHADARFATVAGGVLNKATGAAATVGGGSFNTADGDGATVSGGLENIAEGVTATVAGGRFNYASFLSFAAGYRAKAMSGGQFVFADSNGFDFKAIGSNRFQVRATGGVFFVTDIDSAGDGTWGCRTQAGFGWLCTSDRRLKHSLVELDGQAVLAKVAALPVYQWQALGQNAHVKHYGPMAQDFHAAFGLGNDETMIGMQDADGVALAAIQGLNAKLEATVAEQARENARLRAELADLRSLKEEVAIIRAERSRENVAGR